MLGSATASGNFSLHTGLTMLVLSSDPKGFRGRWEVQALRRQRPEGFFCASRGRRPATSDPPQARSNQIHDLPPELRRVWRVRLLDRGVLSP